MKKFISTISAFLLIFLLMFSVNLTNEKCFAESNSVPNSIEFALYQQNVLENFSKLKNRENGSEGEKNAAMFIKNQMDELCNENSSFSAENSASCDEGIQKFRFTSVIDDKDYYSQNVIYHYKSNAKTDKKVIIATNYDSVAFEFSETETKTIESESVNSSGGSVALLLSIAKFVKNFDLPFNLEFIFFGAGESDNAGSKYYVKGISSDEKDNILCMINLDSIAVGKNLYYYINEVETDWSKFVSNVMEDTKLKQVSTVHLGKNFIDDENSLGLGYSHIALNSDNINFMSQDILCVNLFAGDYESGIIYGRSEFGDCETINYTKNDNLDYIAENFGTNHVTENLYNTYTAIMSLLENLEFEANCVSMAGQTKTFYDFFGNQKLIAYLTAVMLIIMIAVAIAVHFKFTLKSYDANVEPEFLSTIISISQNIDETCADENVPKAVSQVIANDIKKDKTIKVKKNRKKDN